MKSFIVIAVAVLLGGLGFAVTRSPGLQSAEAGGNQGAELASSARYITAPVVRGDVRRTITTTGTLNALVTVEVGTQLSGQVAELYADFNDEVLKGRPLAQLDTKSFQARLDEARAARKMAEATVEIQRARLDRARVDALNTAAQRAVLKARVENARVRFDAAESLLRRAQALWDRGASSVSNLEEAQLGRDSAAAALREAEATEAAHEHAVAGAEIDVKRAEAELANAMASVPQKTAVERSAEIDLSRTTILSPVSGVVVGRNVNQGQTVAASLEAPVLFTIAGDLRQMSIYARVDESDIGQVRVGQKASFTVDAYPDRHFDAAVTGIRKAPETNQNVVTYTVVLVTENPDSLLLPGMTATVSIAVDEANSVLKVPMAALLFSPGPPQDDAGAAEQASDGSGRVWVPAGENRLSAVSVTVGVDDGTDAALLEGTLQEGDRVITGEVPEEDSGRLLGLRFGF